MPSSGWERFARVTEDPAARARTRALEQQARRPGGHDHEQDRRPLRDRLTVPGADDVLAELEAARDRPLGAPGYNYLTMLQFVVSRPPATIEEAWALADEQALVAPCTTLLPGVPLRRHAQALVGRR